jgi:hypothetical protein
MSSEIRPSLWNLIQDGVVQEASLVPCELEFFEGRAVRILFVRLWVVAEDIFARSAEHGRHD